MGVSVGAGVPVCSGVAVGTGVPVGAGVAVCTGVGVGVGVPPCHGSVMQPASSMTAAAAMMIRLKCFIPFTR